jgi:hypothetical protein
MSTARPLGGNLAIVSLEGSGVNGTLGSGIEGSVSIRGKVDIDFL